MCFHAFTCSRTSNSFIEEWIFKINLSIAKQDAFFVVNPFSYVYQINKALLKEISWNYLPFGLWTVFLYNHVHISLLKIFFHLAMHTTLLIAFFSTCIYSDYSIRIKGGLQVSLIWFKTCRIKTWCIHISKMLSKIINSGREDSVYMRR